MNKLNLPLAIIIGALLVSGAIFYTKKGPTDDSVNWPGSNNNIPKIQTPGQGQPQPQGNVENVLPVSSADHIQGSLQAKVKIIEFSDLECPFCKEFHQTLKEIMDVYEKQGQAAWIYRHFPIENLHSKAPKESQAAECASSLGGENKFWAYIDRLLEITPSNNGLSPLELPKIATYIGINENEFNSCLNSNKFASKVNADTTDAVNSGGRGTPYTIIIAKNGAKTPLSGAYPVEQMKIIIDEALR